MTEPEVATTHEQELNCPMCGYNLHGLPEPRCPECGYRFTWEEVQAKAMLHPYLFEHHPERNITSFLQTLFAALWPWRFWASINPNQPSNRRRLIIFYLIEIVPIILAIVIYLSAIGVEAAEWNQTQRAIISGFLTKTGNSQINQNLKSYIAPFVTMQQYLDQTYPPTWSLGFFRRIFAQAWASPISVLPILAILPWMMGLILMIFRQSLRQKRLKSIHLVRVSVYWGTIVSLFALLWAALSIWKVLSLVYPNLTAPELLSDSAQGIAITAVSLYSVVALAFAIQRYLRLRHAWTTSIAVHIILILAGSKLVLLWHGY